MTTTMKRLTLVLKAALMGALALGAMAPWIASAATGPWSWHDISGQLTEQNNRPVWAVAHDNDGWFYTDGQNLWNGGQVYRYDGSTQVNVTNDVRSAGIDRVDDIVTDNAGTVLFLQDVVRLDNTLRVVAYRNGSYTNVTSNVRNVLNSDEGISKVNGRDGTWYVVTTKARIFRFDANISNSMEVKLPPLHDYSSFGASSFLYNVNNGSPSPSSGSVQLDIVPIANNNWLLVAGPPIIFSTAMFYRYDGTTFTDITPTIASNIGSSIGTDVASVYKIVSNGTSAIISMRSHMENAHSAVVYMTDGSAVGNVPIGGNPDLTNAVIGWNGTSWMVVNGKELFRVSGSITNPAVEDFGRTNDLILSIAGDSNTNFLLGGAVSTQSSNDPTNPLTAKLIKVIEDGGTSESTVTSGGTFGGDRVFTSANGPRVTIQGNPSGFRVGNGGMFNYRATATDPNGVRKTDIYLNDALIRTCQGDSCEYDATFYTKNLPTRTVKFYVRATDTNGNVTDTSSNPDYLVIDENSTATATGTITNTSTNSTQSNTGNGITTWDWLDPNVSSFNGGDAVTYNVGAYDANGIKSIQIIANGSVRQTCNLNNATGNQQCAATLYANDYAANTNVFVNAQVTDGNGNVAWTNGKNIYRNGTTGSNSNSNNTNASVWESFSPDVTSLGANQTLSYQANAQDNDGVSRIDIYANGSIKQTCTLGNTTGNTSCTATIYANDYGTNTNVFVNAKVTDANGNVTWTSGRTVNVTSSSTNSNNTNASVSESFSPDETSFGSNDTVTYRVNAVDSDGINRIDLYANGAVKQSCTFGNTTGNAQCSATIYANDYSVNTNVFVNAKVTDANGNVTWTSGRTISRNGSTGSNSNNTNASVSESFSPDVTSFNTNDTISYSVNAQDNDGVNRIDLYANGNVKQTCNLGNTTSNVTCSTTIFANDYSANTNVFVNAKVTDGNGNVTWTSGRTIFKNGTGSNVSNQSNVETNRWIWLDPNQTTLTANGQITFNVGAQDGNGISRIDIYVNGSIKQTCNPGNSTSNVQCSATLFANDYPQNTDVFVNAKITDAFGNIAWTDSRTLRRGADVSTSTTQTSSQSGTISAWEWLDPNMTSVAQNASMTYHAGAWASAGMNTITVYVNGNALPVCSLGNAFGNVECAKTLNGTDYAIGSSVFVNAKVTDANGKVAWTAGRTFNVTALSSSNAITLPSQAFVMNASNAYTTISANRNSYAQNDQITYTANASDPDGVQRIEMYLNAERVQTCTGTTTCSITTSKYTSYPWIQFHIVAYDKNGNFSSSPTMTIWKK